MTEPAHDPRQEWATPTDFYSVVEAEFHPTIDVCARATNTKCDVWISPEDDALAPETIWLPRPHLVAWCNPGFANMKPWIEKAIAEAKREPCGVILVLGLAAPSTAWWRLVVDNAIEIRLLGGRRIQFEPAGGIGKSSNSRENALFIFQDPAMREWQEIVEYNTWYWRECLP